MHGMRRQFCGKHKMCEYVLSGRMTVSGACGDNRFHIPAIRVWSVLLFDDKIEGEWGPCPHVYPGPFGTACASMCFLAE